MEKVLKIYGKSFKNMGGFYIGHLYWIIQGTLEERMELR